MSIPLATYRIQLQPNFGFDAVAELAEYLAALGVTHVYASPYLQAQSGSTHGYDVLDHRRPNEELGGFPGHERMCRELARHGLGQILDIVPNHMSISSRQNRWWWDVLENGQASRYASYFDVDWHPPEERLRNVVVLPVLGDHFGRVLERREIRLVRDGGTFAFHYFDHLFPVAPRSIDDLLASAAQRARSDELAFLADAHGHLPISTESDRRSIALRHRDKEVLRRLLARLCNEQPAIAKKIDDCVAEANSDPTALGQLLDRQNYRLAFWRTAGEELGYRRFFDINTLASLQMEDEQVFEDAHALVFEWVDRGVVDGLRIDHPDGLRDPEEYFQRIRQRSADAWLVIEKILQSGEWLPAHWPVHGTTGYDFLNRVIGLLMAPEGEGPLTDFYREFTGEERSFDQIVREKKIQVLRESFATEVHRLASLLVQVCERHARYRDYTRRELRAVIREIIAGFPVYRTYARATASQISDADVAYIDQAVATAQANMPDVDGELFQFVRGLLTLEYAGELENEFAMRFQQVTGPVMAKGVEDTAFYSFNRMTVLNEVGGEPSRFSYSLEQFHWNCQETQKSWPLSMLTTTTHDTKRSEDVRSRLSLLSEIPEQWIAAVRRWTAMNEKYKTQGTPDHNVEYAMYQTLVGTWPLSLERAITVARKSLREAKIFTSWTQVRAEYEEQVLAFITSILADREFVEDLEQFLRPLVAPAQVKSLTQTLLKLTTPGIPDIYQGNELWDHSLVDPDNRRPVNFQLRKQLIDEVAKLSPEQIVERMNEGLPKLWVTRQSLHLRRARPEPFGADSTYTPLWATGTFGDGVVAFRRAGDVVVVAPIRVIKTLGNWQDTAITIPEGAWKNEFTGETWTSGEVKVDELLGRFPVALLARTERGLSAIEG